MSIVVQYVAAWVFYIGMGYLTYKLIIALLSIYDHWKLRK